MSPQEYVHALDVSSDASVCHLCRDDVRQMNKQTDLPRWEKGVKRQEIYCFVSNCTEPRFTLTTISIENNDTVKSITNLQFRNALIPVLTPYVNHTITMQFTTMNITV